MNEIKTLCEEILTLWCEKLLSLQNEDGAIDCPACEILHGRCFDSMYPFLFLFHTTQDEKWRRGALDLFAWAEKNVSQEDGSYKNDLTSEWAGTTVFSLIQLLDSLTEFGHLLDSDDRKLIERRARKAAEYLFAYDDLKNRNINYPIANSLALFLAYHYFNDERYLLKSDEFIAVWKSCFTNHRLLYGEGRPREGRTAKGVAPIDIGYNLEESLPSIIRLGLLRKDQELVKLAAQSLQAHQMFMLSDGGIDNSFGSRSFKWTYYGSRTSDGMTAALLMVEESNPLFAWAALQNLRLQKACTVEGLLSGGPSYGAASQKPCIHHSFTHAKVLAFILQEKLYPDNPIQEQVLPRYTRDGIHTFEEVASSTMSRVGYTATVTVNDWVYLAEGHPSGGSLTILHHEKAGMLLASSMNDYVLKEPNNMQLPLDVRHHECLTPRIEFTENGQVYTSVYDFSATMENVSDYGIRARGVLKSREGGTSSPYSFHYTMRDNGLNLVASHQDGVMIVPLITESGDIVTATRGGISIQRKGYEIMMVSPNPYVLPYQMERIFHLIPGFQAIRVEYAPIDGNTTIQISVEKL